MAPETLNAVFSPYGIDPMTSDSYPPHPTQEKIRTWVRSVREGTITCQGIPTLYCQHGVNSGGTRGAMAPILEYAFEQPGLNVLVGREDFSNLRKSGMRTFFTIVDPALIVHKDEQLHAYQLRAAGTGAAPSTIWFAHVSDPDSLGSQEFAAILVIEAHEITEEAFRKLRNRARQGLLPSFLILEGNPPSEGHWLAQMTRPGSPTYDPSITVLELPSTENWDYMTMAYKQTLEAMPPAWRRRYLLGKTGFLPSGTPVYPSFIESLHGRKTSLIPDRPLIRSWDFGWRRAGCLWSQRADSGQLLVHREWMPVETPESEFIDGVKQRTLEWYGPMAAVDYGDPAARNRDPEGINTLTRLDRAGIKMLYRDSEYAERIPLINQRLCLLIGGEPAIVVDPVGCPILTEALLGGYHYPEIKLDQKFSEKHEIPEHDQWFSHLANAFEYLMINLYGGTPTAYREKRQKLVQARRKQLQRRTGVVSF